MGEREWGGGVIYLPYRLRYTESMKALQEYIQCPSLRRGKPTVQEKMIGTLTLTISKSIYELISLIFLYNLCSMATTKHSKSLLLANHVSVVAL